jgi:hypothetical protein
MLRTDLDGFMTYVKDSPVAKLGVLIIFLIVLYCVASWYLSKSDSKNNFANIMVLKGNTGCHSDIPKIDEAIIRAHISLPNRDPKLLTTSMVLPEPTIKEENIKQTRMEILNMFYNSFDDDKVNVSSRPQGLYLIP